MENEKLIANPTEPELLDSGETKPLLSGKEFIAKTSVADLKNVFGLTDKELPLQKISPTPPPPNAQGPLSEKFSRFESLLPELRKKPTPPVQNATPQKKEVVGTGKNIPRFLITVFLIIIVIIIGLYIWGGIIKSASL